MLYIGVIGSGNCDEQTGRLAYQVGKSIAQHGALLVCGGKGGVMEKRLSFFVVIVFLEQMLPCPDPGAGDRADGGFLSYDANLLCL